MPAAAGRTGGSGATSNGGAGAAGTAGGGASGGGTGGRSIVSEGFYCSSGMIAFGVISDTSGDTFVRCNPTSGVECVPRGDSCPGLDAGRDADLPDAHSLHDAAPDSRTPDAD